MKSLHTFETWFSLTQPEIKPVQSDAVLKLSAEGATVPFIARYRKEQTGNLDEVAIRAVIEGKEEFDQIVARQKHIEEEIEKQGVLTDELRTAVRTTYDLTTLEDLYLPYKKKRKTKAMIAKEAGLEPLANWIWNCGHGIEQPAEGQTLDLWAFTFRSELNKINTAEEAIDGAESILIERLSESLELREKVRQTLFNQGYIRTEKGPKPKPHSKFEHYFTYQEKIKSLQEPQNSHRYLAIKRGWIEEELALHLGAARDQIEAFDQELLSHFETAACTVRDLDLSKVLLKAARLSLKAFVLPSIESEVHAALRKNADEAAVKVFAENVRQLLLAAPLGSKAVIGVDPGIRTGCKVAFVETSGKYIGSFVMYFDTEAQQTDAKKHFSQIFSAFEVSAIAVGNGTNGRETETYLRKLLKELEKNIPVAMVSEAGASVYSASDVAREEFPELDLTIRGAISIARRLQDPLAELVKVDPKSIGVGQYQHDVSQNLLKRTLEGVVESCVNQVGVNLNTASYHLLSYISGIGPGLAKAIVEYRSTNGLFKSRDALLEVPRFSKKTFEQAAGFLRIPDSENPLDHTGVHPEKYGVLNEMATSMGKTIRDLIGAGARTLKEKKEWIASLGEFTFNDIVNELEKPGRDPRESFVPFSFRDDIFELKDLKKDMICPGIVTNVTNFGAFVDIGVHQDGLVHISEISNQFIRDPREAVKPGDRVTIKVLDVNLEKKQIALSIKQGKAPGSYSGRGDAPQAARAPRSDKPRVTPVGESPARNFPKPQPNRPDRGPRTSPHSGGGAQQKPRPSPKPTVAIQPAKPAFNNAFAALAALKGKK